MKILTVAFMFLYNSIHVYAVSGIDERVFRVEFIETLPLHYVHTLNVRYLEKLVS